MLTLKTSNFRHTHKTKVKFDPRTKNMSVSVLTLKPSQLLSPTQIQVNFDPNTEVKSILIPSLKTTQFGMPPDTKNELISIQTLKQVSFDPHTNQVKYDPYTEIRSTPIPTTEIMSIWTTHTTESISMPTIKPYHFRALLLCVLYVHTSTCSCDTAVIRII